MQHIQRLLRFIRAHPSVGASILGALLVFGLLGLLGSQATSESNLRKSPAALEFEAGPDAWLLKPATVGDFRKALDAGQLKAVGQAASPPSLLLYTLKSGEKASTKVPNCDAYVCAGTVLDRLGDQSAAQGFAFVRVDVDARTSSQRILGGLAALKAPLGLVLSMIAVLYVLLKMQAGTGGGASRLAERPTLRFHDVVGNEEAKAQLRRVKAFLQDPQAYARIGARAPRGVLMVGPPGTGKTLLAKALAGESHASFIAVDGSYFSSMFYGAGITKVKSLFALARKNAPCILLIDEADGLSKRTSSPEMRGADSESNRIINRILVELDGFEDLEGVVVIAATNHEKNMDEALRRPGRFDVLVRMSMPTLPERKSLFELYLQKVTHDAHIDSDKLARMTAGVSPADIANLVNKASSSAAEEQAAQVVTQHVVRAIETYRMGGEVSPIKGLLSEATRERLAYHEAAHALVGHWLQLGTIEHLTIEPRGEALGVTYITRETEDPIYRESELQGRLAMTLAGREAELLVFGDVSSGAADDLKRTTELAISMVANLGFSREFGVMSVAGIPAGLQGPDVQATVLNAARTLLGQGQRTCRDLLGSRRGQLDALAQALLAAEVLSGPELRGLLEPKHGPL